MIGSRLSVEGESRVRQIKRSLSGYGGKCITTDWRHQTCIHMSSNVLNKCVSLSSEMGAAAGNAVAGGR